MHKRYYLCIVILNDRVSLGEMPEWSNGAVSKTVVLSEYQGFESLSLRSHRGADLQLMRFAPRFFYHGLVDGKHCLYQCSLVT